MLRSQEVPPPSQLNIVVEDPRGPGMVRNRVGDARHLGIHDR